MKKNNSLMLNILLIVFEIIGFCLSYSSMHRIGIEYYTELSNLLALFVSIIFVFYLISKKRIPKWLSELKYISNINLAITFFVVIFILVPMLNFDYNTYLINGAMKYHHLICPLVSVSSFIFCDKLGNISKKDAYYGLIFTFVYAVVLIILNIAEVLVGPYPFLRVYDQTLLASIIWLIGLLGFSLLTAFILRSLYISYNKES